VELAAEIALVRLQHLPNLSHPPASSERREPRLGTPRRERAPVPVRM
jgi:hypothetical protein